MNSPSLPDLYQVAITFIPNIGPILAKNLISYCGSCEAVFSASMKDLSRIPGIGQLKSTAIMDQEILRRAEEELNFMKNEGVGAAFYLDPQYPARLKNFDTAPVILYYKGKLEETSHRTVGIVGTRNPSETGRWHTQKLIEDLKPFGVTIVSGMTHGIDGAAHKKSLDCQLRTVGVMGHGMDMIYPAAHRYMANKMVEKGVLVSEFPSRTLPDRVNFPMRNRIIAALSDIVVVVESKRKGGSMITALIANEYNKDVFAFPGRPGDELSQGCNHLIKSNQAHLIESGGDILYITRWEALDKPRAVQVSLFTELEDDEATMVSLLRQKGEAHVDLLLTELKVSTSQLASTLLNLEFKGLIRSLPGKKYTLNGV